MTQIFVLNAKKYFSELCFVTQILEPREQFVSNNYKKLDMCGQRILFLCKIIKSRNNELDIEPRETFYVTTLYTQCIVQPTETQSVCIWVVLTCPGYSGEDLTNPFKKLSQQVKRV